MTDTVDPRRIALRAEISQLFGRADAPGIDATEARTRIAAAAALTAVLASSEPDHFTTTILAAVIRSAPDEGTTESPSSVGRPASFASEPLTPSITQTPTSEA